MPEISENVGTYRLSRTFCHHFGVTCVFRDGPILHGKTTAISKSSYYIWKMCKIWKVKDVRIWLKDDFLNSKEACLTPSIALSAHKKCSVEKFEKFLDPSGWSLSMVERWFLKRHKCLTNVINGVKRAQKNALVKNLTWKDFLDPLPLSIRFYQNFIDEIFSWMLNHWEKMQNIAMRNDRNSSVNKINPANLRMVKIHNYFAND